MIDDAELEPELWRPYFPASRYRHVCDILDSILLDIRVMFQCQLGLLHFTYSPNSLFGSGGASSDAAVCTVAVDGPEGKDDESHVNPLDAELFNGQQHLASLEALKVRIESMQPFRDAIFSVFSAIQKRLEPACDTTTPTVDVRLLSPVVA